tara:strand:+ start:1185 stop:1562 length:378 start_codon:yes stop_codon:yes gene_type:complete
MRINDGYKPDEELHYTQLKTSLNSIGDYSELVKSLPEEAQMEIQQITKTMAVAMSNRSEEISTMAADIPKTKLGSDPTPSEVTHIALLELLALLAWSTSNAHKALGFLIQQQSQLDDDDSDSNPF